MSKTYKLNGAQLQRVIEHREEMLLPVQAVHGAKYAEVMESMLKLIHAHFDAAAIFCGHISPLVKEAVVYEMSTAFNGHVIVVIKLLFEADIADGAKMDNHYQTFTGQLMRISEATQRFENQLVEEVLGGKKP